MASEPPKPPKPTKPAIMPTGWIFLVALVPNIPALFFIWLLFLRCGCTHYAPGFTEAKFASLKEGMTAAEVEAVMGPPLARIDHGDWKALWTYSDRDDDTCGFQKRWVYLETGKVTIIENTTWIE
jgi:hypothetical protein